MGLGVRGGAWAAVAGAGARVCVVDELLCSYGCPFGALHDRRVVKHDRSDVNADMR